MLIWLKKVIRNSFSDRVYEVGKTLAIDVFEPGSEKIHTEKKEEKIQYLKNYVLKKTEEKIQYLL